jgi:hypothetical protein
VTRPGFVARAGDRPLFTRAASLARISLYLPKPKGHFLGKGPATHDNQQVGEMRIEFLACKEEGHCLQRSGEHFEGSLKKAQEESNSAEQGRQTKEEVLSVGVSSKEESEERTREWWEGYDPAMDASF